MMLRRAGAAMERTVLIGIACSLISGLVSLYWAGVAAVSAICRKTVAIRFLSFLYWSRVLIPCRYVARNEHPRPFSWLRYSGNAPKRIATVPQPPSFGITHAETWV